MGFSQLAKKGCSAFLAAVLSLSLLIALPTEEAQAWDSYESIFGHSNPLHEDMTQLAYVKLLNQPIYASTVSNPETGAGENSLLYVSTDAQYQAALYYLKQGAYWNDVAANNGPEFLLNYKLCDVIDSYKKGSYDGTYDIAEHLQQNYSRLTRVGVRFSHNRRGNILHSMLGMQPNGKTYLTQKKQLDYSLEWLEAAYKYASNDPTITVEQKYIVEAFVNPYRQLSESKLGVTYPDFIDAKIPADMWMSKDELRLRALGMMCHTIEDSYNPAHSIRSYAEDVDGNRKAGDILAFGVYEIQKLHADYDHIAKVDDPVRIQAIEDTLTDLDKVKAYDASGVISGFKTLGLSDAADGAYSLLERFYRGEKWGNGADGLVGDWLTNTIFACQFDSTDNSTYIYEGGIRAGNTEALEEDAKSLSSVLPKYFPKYSEAVKGALPQYKALTTYRDYLNGFYHENLADKKKEYLPTAEKEQEAVNAALSAFCVYENLLLDADYDVSGILGTLSPETRATLKRLISNTAGIVQELSLERNGTLADSAFNANADNLLQRTKNLLNILNFTGGVVKGSVESVSESEFVLRLNDGSGSMLIESPAAAQLEVGMRNVEVGYTVVEVDSHVGYYRYTATVEAVDTSESGNDRIRDAKGTLKSSSAAGVKVAIDGYDGEGQEPFTFLIADGVDLSLVKEGDRVSIDYSLSGQDLVCRGIEKLEDVTLSKQTGVVYQYYGNTMIVEYQVESGLSSEDVTDPPEDLPEGAKFDPPATLPEYVGFSFDNADFVGSLAISAEVEVLYSGEPVFSQEQEFDGMYRVYSASRIKVASHNAAHEDDNVLVCNHDATHSSICLALDDMTTANCTLGLDGTCPDCGYIFGKYSISGKTIDSAVNLGMSASVQLFDGDGKKVGSAIASDEDGSFAFYNVYEGYGYTVRASKAGYSGGVSQSFNLIGDKVALGDIALNPPPTPMSTYSISGVIVDESTKEGIPAIIQLRDAEGNNVVPAVQAAADGSYTIPDVISSSGYTITIVLGGYISKDISSISVSDADVTGMNAELSPDNVGPMKVYAVSGTVSYEATGEGLPAQVQLKDASGEDIAVAVTAEDDGSYRIPDILPGVKYTVEASMPGYTTASSTAFDVVDEDVNNRDVRLSTAPVVVPVLTSGDGSSWSKGSKTGLLFVSSADFAAYTGTWIDGKKLADGKDCKATEGSIRVVVEPAYLETLAAGAHTIKIGSTQGDVEGAFQITKAPGPVPTGDSIPLTLVAVICAGAAFLALFASYRLRRRAK